MATIENKSWTLQSFVDALVYELDKARYTLSVKGLNNPLSYAVKDLSVELQVFPDYSNNEIKFTTARSGQNGSSKIAFQLGSITDRQIRETSRQPLTDEEVTIDALEIDEEAKKEMKKIGIQSVKDIEKMEENNINIKTVVQSDKINFSDLAGKIEKAKRNKLPPKLSKAVLSHSLGQPTITISGENLHVVKNFKPRVFVNKKEVAVLSYSSDMVDLQLDGTELKEGENTLTMFLDPYTRVNFKVT